MTKVEILLLLGILILAFLVVRLYIRKPEVTIVKYDDGIAWKDKEGNTINSLSK